MSPETQIQGI